MEPDRAVVEENVRAHLLRGEVDLATTVAIRRLGPDILGYLRAILRDEDVAGDAFAVFCEHLWKGIGSFRGDGSLVAWLYAVAWGVVRRFANDPYRKRRQRLRTTMVSQIADEGRASTAVHLRTDVKDRMARLRESLDPDDHSLLILRVDRQLSWAEVARALADEGSVIDEAALRKRFERVKAKLRKLAVAEGLLVER